METIRLFLQLVDPTLLQVHFDSLYKTISEQSNDKIDDFTRDACHDLMRVMLKFQDYGSIEKIYKFAASAFTNKDHKKQKKAYKLLEEICVSESESSKTFLESNLEDIQKTLLDSLSKASPPSQASRIKCLINIIKNLEKGKPITYSNVVSRIFLLKNFFLSIFNIYFDVIFYILRRKCQSS